MKFKTTLFIFIVFVTKCFPQWMPIDTMGFPSSCAGCCVGITTKFINEDDAYWWSQYPHCSPTWVAGFSIQRTSNSFTTNSYLSFPYNSSNYTPCYSYDKQLEDLDIVSYDTVYMSYKCGGATPFFIRTFDAGSTWTNLSTNNRPGNLTFVNGRLGYGFNNNNFYKFWNDSLYLVSTVTIATINYHQLYFTDSLTGYALLQHSQYDYTADTIIRTIDGGLTWTQLPIPNGRKFDSKTLQTLSNSVAYIYADSGDVFKTINSGNTWVKTIKYDSLGYIQFLSESKLYNIMAIGVHAYYNVSKDSGMTWKTTPMFGYNTKGFRMINDSVGYASTTISTSSGSPRLVILKILNAGSVGINEVKTNLHQIYIYPNPSRGDFTIHIDSEFKNSLLEIYDMLGERIYSEGIINTSSKEIHLNMYPSGIYFVKVIEGENIYFEKIILQ
jgi:hypothetical protein